MSTQLYLARGITEGRAWSRQDRALLRDVELAKAGAARPSWRRRRPTRDA